MNALIRDAKLGLTCQRVTVVLLVVCSLIALYIAGNFSYGRWSASKDTRHFLVLSSRNESLDSNLIRLTNENTRLSYGRLNTDFGKSFAAQQGFKIQDKPQLVLIDDSKTAGVNWTDDMAKIQPMIDEMRNQVDISRTPVVLLMAVCGFIASVLGHRLVPKALVFILAALAAISYYKFLHSCPTCPVVQLLGIVDIAIAGTVFYAVAGFLSKFVKGPVVTGSIGVVAACVAVWQLFQFASGHEQCVPCGLILMGNLLVAFAAALNPLPEVTEVSAPSLRSSLRYVIPAAIALLLIQASQMPETVGTKGPGPKAEKKWMGHLLTELGIKRTSNDPQVVVLGVPTCEPCIEARRYLSLNLELPIRFVDMEGDQSTANGIDRIARKPGLVPGSPAIFVVSKEGKITGEHYGWLKDDKLFTEAFLATLKQELYPKYPSKEIK